MNTRLQSLFDKYNVWEKNRYEISQFFLLLDERKRKNLLDNFEILAYRLEKIEQDIKEEREILIWKSVDRVKNYILEKRKKVLDSDAKSDIDLLRGEL